MSEPGQNQPPVPPVQYAPVITFGNGANISGPMTVAMDNSKTTDNSTTHNTTDNSKTTDNSTKNINSNNITKNNNNNNKINEKIENNDDTEELQNMTIDIDNCLEGNGSKEAKNDTQYKNLKNGNNEINNLELYNTSGENSENGNKISTANPFSYHSGSIKKINKLHQIKKRKIDKNRAVNIKKIKSHIQHRKIEAKTKALHKLAILSHSTNSLIQRRAKKQQTNGISPNNKRDFKKIALRSFKSPNSDRLRSGKPKPSVHEKELKALPEHEAANDEVLKLNHCIDELKN